VKKRVSEKKGKEMANGGRKEGGEDEAGRIGGRLRHDIGRIDAPGSDT